MTEIKELDMNKYLVIKREDLEEYFSRFTKGIFTTKEEQEYIDSTPFNTVLKEIQARRKYLGKKENKYLVLNLDDEINLEDLVSKLNTKRQEQNNKTFAQKHELYLKKDIEIDELIDSQRAIVHINDIAVDLVNAILKAKEK